MMKWLFALMLFVSAGASARDGFKVGADNTKWFTWYGGVALYQDAQDEHRCKFYSISKSVDKEGNAFEATGFTCGKDLFIVIKEYMDNRDVLLIVMNPAKFEERKTYKVELFLEYNKDDKK